MVQSAMLVALGFLVASLLALLFAPAFWARAVRLTTARIKASLPVSETEIRAEKDQLRAQNAVRVHQLGKEIEKAKLSAARQFVELNRRDAKIADLEDRASRLQSDLEENQNARRVLEQTINDRLPRLEAHLEEARKLLGARDRELAELIETARKQESALDEGAQINRQQAHEIERLTEALMAHQPRDRRRFIAPQAESEQAMRGELEALRARMRDQATLIDRLRMSAAGGNGSERTGPPSGHDGTLMGALELAANGEESGIVADLRAQLSTLTERTEEQDREVDRLRAELAELIASDTKSAKKVRIGETKMSLRSKLKSVQAQLDHESQRSSRLKTELTAANERAARQAAYYMVELKRFGGAAPRLARGAQALVPSTTPSGRGATIEETPMDSDGDVPARTPAKKRTRKKPATATTKSPAARTGPRSDKRSRKTKPSPKSKPEAAVEDGAAATEVLPKALSDSANATSAKPAEPGPDNDTGAKGEADEKPGSRLLERLRTYEST